MSESRRRGGFAKESKEPTPKDGWDKKTAGIAEEKRITKQHKPNKPRTPSVLCFMFLFVFVAAVGTLQLLCMLYDGKKKNKQTPLCQPGPRPNSLPKYRAEASAKELWFMTQVLIESIGFASHPAPPPSMPQSRSEV